MVLVGGGVAVCVDGSVAVEALMVALLKLDAGSGYIGRKLFCTQNKLK